MDNAELNRIRDHVQLHATKPQCEPIKGYGLARTYIRFAAWALPLLIEHGEIVVEPEDDEKQRELAQDGPAHAARPPPPAALTPAPLAAGALGPLKNTPPGPLHVVFRAR